MRVTIIKTANDLNLYNLMNKMTTVYLSYADTYLDNKTSTTSSSTSGFYAHANFIKIFVFLYAKGKEMHFIPPRFVWSFPLLCPHSDFFLLLYAHADSS